MFEYRHLELLSQGPVSRVRLLKQKPLCAEELAELTREWNSVADRADCRLLFVDCSSVQVMSSELLSKLILLQWKLKQKKGRLVLAGLRDEIREVMSWTKLDRFFEIKRDEELEAAVCA